MPKAVGLGLSKNGAWRLNQPPQASFTRIHDGEDIALSLNPDLQEVKDHIAHHSRPEGDVVIIDGLSYLIETSTSSSLAASGGNLITAPMPGSIIAVNASLGDTVTAGDALIIMEAMKMEMTLEAPRDGIIQSINIKPGERVADGDILLTLEEEGATS